MDTKSYAILLALALVFLGIMIALSIISRKTPPKTQEQLDKIKKKDSYNYLYTLQRIYLVTPFVRRYFKKLKNQTQILLPADEVTLNKKTTEKMTGLLALSIGLIVAIFIFGGNDIPYMMVGILTVYILFTDMVNNSGKRLKKKILDQLDVLISEVHTNYNDSHIPSAALSDALDNMPYEISLHGNIINDVISSADPDTEIENYVDQAPNKFLLLFAAILETVEEHGDKEIDGRSMLLKNLDALKQELANERLRLQKRENAFMGKTYSVLIALFVCKPIQMWALKNFPEMASFYGGGFGVITLAIIMAVAFLCYEAINILKDDHDELERDERLYKKLSDIPAVKKEITAYINHNYTKCQRVSDKLKSVGEKNGIAVFITKRCVYALVSFIVALIICIYSVGREKREIIKDFSQAYSSSIVPDAQYRENMQASSKEYKKQIKKGATREDYEALVAGEEYAPMYKDLMITELTKRSEDYQKKNFKWWMLLLSLGIGGLGYLAPYALLSYKSKIVGQAREDEVAQFRTVILILMHEDGMTVDKLLEWMERFAHAYKASITDCIFALETNETKALMDMREKERGFDSFRQLCNNLISVDTAGIEEAFGSLETDREYYKEDRKETGDRLLKNATAWATVFEMIPIAVAVTIYLVIPLVTLVTNMMSELNLG